MLLLPKIVIQNGQSLYQINDKEIASPEEIAAQLVRMGFSWIYVQNLDSDIDGDSFETLARIIDHVDVPIAFEGAVRDIQTVDRLFGEGVSRVILNNLSLNDHQFIQEACGLYPDQIAIHILSDQGKVPVAEGHDNILQFELSKIAPNLAEYGVYALFYSEVESDSEPLKQPGLDMHSTTSLANNLNVPLIYAGSVNHVEDLLSIAAVSEQNIAGALLGGGLYSGQISADDALQIASGISLYQQKTNDN